MPLVSSSKFHHISAAVEDITEAGPAEQLCDDLMRQPYVAWDTETLGHNIRKESPVGKARCVVFSVCFEEDRAYCIKNYGEQEGMIKIFKPWFENERCKKLTHHGKYDRHVVANHGIMARGNVFDSIVGAWLLDENASKSLEEQVARYFNEKYPTFAETFRYRPFVKSGNRRALAYKTPGLEDVIDPRSNVYQPAKLAYYSAKDAWNQYRLGLRVRDELSKISWHGDLSLLDYYNTVELPYHDVLFGMERAGIALDVEFLSELSTRWVSEIEECRSSFISQAVALGVPQSFLRDLNLASDKKIAELFFSILEMPPGRETKTGFSVDDAELSRLEEEGYNIVKPLRRINSLEKLRGTYSDALPSMVDKNGRVHTTFNQTGTVTARLSSSNPNLQNIPIRTEDGALLREAFVAEKGHKFLDADLSQIELRLMADFSKDGRMLEGFHSGLDFHSFTAKGMFSQVADVPIEDIKEKYPELRSKGKTLNFGIQYGMGPGKLAKDWGVSLDEAKRILDLYHKTYPRVGVFKRETLMFARTNGYVRTLLRRYRRLPDIDSSDRAIRSYAEREAVNSIIQGSAADVIKMAMILIHRDEELRQMGYKMLLQVHDEILGEVPKENVEKAKAKIAIYMAKPYKYFGLKPLSLDTPADVGIGMNWAEAH